MILVGVMIFFNLGSPVFFKQQRVGQNLRCIKITKFRTMKGDGKPIKDFSDYIYRTTKLTRFLRKTKVDELPQFFSVAVGDLALVGPRPLLKSSSRHFSIEGWRKRHIIKPGITGLAQIKSADEMQERKREKFDLFYVKKRSFYFDALILCQTVSRIVKKRRSY